jgi:two-component system cell cycle sensor histidine kinase/response regulator CckA
MHFSSPLTYDLARNPCATSGTSAKVLIVEDNDVVSDCLQMILRAYGYSPLLAVTPEQAVEHCQRERCAIHAVIAEVRLGNSRGFEMASLLRKICPGMKVIFTSGVPYYHLVRSGLLPEQLGDAIFLQKPFLAGDVISSLKVSNVPDVLH